MKPNLQQLVRQFIPTIVETTSYIQTEFLQRKTIQFETKQKNEVVSKVDRTAEQMLVKKAKELFPEAGFLTEEKTIASNEKEYCWIIDPVDGTTNFYYGIPFFAISVALLHNQQPIAGIVCDVMHNDVYTAWQNGGCFVNDTPIACATILSTKEVFLATGIPNFDFDATDQYLFSLQQMIEHTRGIRRLGSAALELAYVAAGKFNAFYESGLKPWDIAASICLIKEAGGIVTDLNGNENVLFGNSILAANPTIHPLLLQFLQEKKGEQ